LNRFEPTTNKEANIVVMNSEQSLQDLLSFACLQKQPLWLK